MTRRQLAGVLLLGGLGAIAAAYWAKRATRSGWEIFLAGPHSGLGYTGTIRRQPDSYLALDAKHTLELYRSLTNNQTAVALREEGKLRWCRLLVISEPLHRTNRQTVLSNVVFKGTVASGEVKKVRFTADVGGDTGEGGLIYLDPDGSFRGFSVSW